MAHWLNWAAKEFSLECSHLHQFRMKGKDICAMGKDAFAARAPSFVGDILWEHLELLQKGIHFFPLYINNVYINAITIITHKKNITQSINPSWYREKIICLWNYYTTQVYHNDRFFLFNIDVTY